MLEEYRYKDKKKLRCGYTTGSCAAAAAKAACFMLLTGRRKETVELLTPKGILLTLSVLEITQGPDPKRQRRRPGRYARYAYFRKRPENGRPRRFH